MMRPLGSARSAGWLADKAGAQAGPGEHKGPRQACPLSSGTQCHGGWQVPRSTKSPLTPLVGLTVPDSAGSEVHEQAMRRAFQKLLPRGWLSLPLPRLSARCPGWSHGCHQDGDRSNPRTLVRLLRVPDCEEEDPEKPLFLGACHSAERRPGPTALLMRGEGGGQQQPRPQDLLEGTGAPPGIWRRRLWWEARGPHQKREPPLPSTLSSHRDRDL